MTINSGIAGSILRSPVSQMRLFYMVWGTISPNLLTRLLVEASNTELNDLRTLFDGENLSFC